MSAEPMKCPRCGAEWLVRGLGLSPFRNPRKCPKCGYTSDEDARETYASYGLFFLVWAAFIVWFIALR